MFEKNVGSTAKSTAVAYLQRSGLQVNALSIRYFMLAAIDCATAERSLIGRR